MTGGGGGGWVEDLVDEQAKKYRAKLRKLRKELKASKAEIQRLRETIVDHGSHQPSYNGRPSCAFCDNFVDDEETHEMDCIVVECERALS